jgi:F-type H+-transporting ATPase subunit b
METEPTGLLADPHTWVLFSTIVFAIIAYIKGKKPLLTLLDSRTARIKHDLEEAARLKNEAQAVLADYQKKHRDAVATAQKIIDNAQESVTLMQKDAEQKLAENLKRRETMLLERISRAEASAVQELRNQAADIAANAAHKLLIDALGKGDARLIDAAIGELPARLN